MNKLFSSGIITDDMTSFDDIIFKIANGNDELLSILPKELMYLSNKKELLGASEDKTDTLDIQKLKASSVYQFIRTIQLYAKFMKLDTYMISDQSIKKLTRRIRNNEESNILEMMFDTEKTILLYNNVIDMLRQCQVFLDRYIHQFYLYRAYPDAYNMSLQEFTLQWMHPFLEVALRFLVIPLPIQIILSVRFVPIIVTKDGDIPPYKTLPILFYSRSGRMWLGYEINNQDKNSSHV